MEEFVRLCFGLFFTGKTRNAQGDIETVINKDVYFVNSFTQISNYKYVFCKKRFGNYPPI